MSNFLLRKCVKLMRLMKNSCVWLLLDLVVLGRLLDVYCFSVGWKWWYLIMIWTILKFCVNLVWKCFMVMLCGWIYWNLLEWWKWKCWLMLLMICKLICNWQRWWKNIFCICRLLFVFVMLIIIFVCVRQVLKSWSVKLLKVCWKLGVWYWKV